MCDTDYRGPYPYNVTCPKIINLSNQRTTTPRPFTLFFMVKIGLRTAWLGPFYLSVAVGLCRFVHLSELLAVARHEDRDFTRRLGKMQQCPVHFLL